MPIDLSGRASAAVAAVRALAQRTIARARADYAEAQGVIGYVAIRLHDKASITAIGAAVVAASALKPSYAIASIAIAVVGVLVPTP